MERDNLEMILEDMSGKFDLVLEGQESLRQEMHSIRDELAEKIADNSFKIDVLNTKIEGVEGELSRKIDSVEQNITRRIDGVEQSLNQKVDALTTDLKAHRADTEVHRGYQVRED